MARFERHRLLCIVPASDLANTTWFALSGARYHLNTLLGILGRPALQRRWQEDPQVSEEQRQSLARNANRFFWHLRAYFWELTATFDHLLQWANQVYGLNITEGTVKWERVKYAKSKATLNQSEWCNKYGLLEAAWNSEWLFEVWQYRNFAHRDVPFMEWEYDEKGNLNPSLVCLPPARVGQQPYVPLTDHLRSYLGKMHQLVSSIIS